MNILFRMPLLAAAVLVTIHASAADGPADPLPKGAKARLGSPRLREPNFWTGAAITPDGKFLVHSGSNGPVQFDLVTGQPAGTLAPKGLGFEGRRIEFASGRNRWVMVANSAVSVWEAGSEKSLAEVKRSLPFGEVGTSLSADGKVLAVGGTQDFNAKGKPIAALVWDVDKNVKRAEVTVVQNQNANVVLSPDGKLLATWGSHYEANPPKDGVDPANDPGRTIQFWDATTGKELSKSRTDGYGTVRIAFAPVGQLVALSSGNGPIRLIDPKTGTETRQLFGRAGQGTRLVFSPDGKTLASAANDGTIQLWGVADGARQALIECPVGPLSSGVRGIAFTGPERAVVWATAGTAALAWEVPSGRLLSPFAGHVAAVKSIAFAPDGKEILTGGEDGRVLRWDAAGKELGEVPLRGAGYVFGGRFPISAVQITADGKSAIASLNGIAVYDLPSGQQTAAPTAGLSYDFRSFLCADARTLLLYPMEPYPPKPLPKSLPIAVWDVTSGAKLCTLDAPVSDVTHAAVTADRTKLVTLHTVRAAGKNEFLVTTWDLATGKKLAALIEPGLIGSSFLALSPDNTHALVGTPEGKLLPVEVATGTASKGIDLNNGRLAAAPVFAPDGKQFALPLTAGYGKDAIATIRVHDAESGKVVATFRSPILVACLAFSPDGKTLASGGPDSTALLWDIAKE